MGRMRGLWRRIVSIARRERVEREIDEELRFHLELETEKGIGRGLNAAEARRQALLSFGGVDRFKDETRRVHGFGVVEAALRDARLSLRMLARSPVFTFASAGTLALAIGAATAIFSVVSAVLLRPSPFPDADRLVMVWETDRASGTSSEPASYPDVADFREQSRSFEAMGSMVGFAARLAEPDGVVRLGGLAVTPGFLESLGVEPLAGRSLAPGDWTEGTGSVVLLGEEYWRARFDGDPAVLGQTLTVNDGALEIVGVLPAEADLGIRQIHSKADYSAGYPGGDVALWVPIQPTPAEYPRSTHPFLTVGRLAPDARIEPAQQELSTISADLESTYPENANRGVRLESYSEAVFGPVRSALRLLVGAVLVVLLVACANVANLLLARAVSRSREVSVRRAIGAGAADLRRQFLVEGAVLTGLGTLGGIGLAYVLLRLLIASAPGDIPRLAGTSIAPGVLGVAVAVSAIVTVVFGLLPGAYAGALDMGRALKSQPGRQASAGREVRALRSALIVGEMGLAVTLVVAGGVMLRSFWELSGVDPGFSARQVLTVSYQLPERIYGGSTRSPQWPDYPEINGFHSELVRRVEALPGVTAAAVTAFHPLDPGFTNSFVIVGREDELGSYPEIRIREASPHYFQTLGIQLLAGRDIDDGDVVGEELVTLINRSAAERYFGSADPVGQRMSWWGRTRTVVGVVDDERMLGLAEPAPPAAYMPLSQSASLLGTLVVRADVDPTSLVPGIREQLRAIDPEVPVFDAAPLEATVAESISAPRFSARLLGTLAAVALLVALIGVHGLLSYSVMQRFQEVGIRMALGAQRSVITREVVGEGLRLAGAGLALGLAGALAASGLLRGMVFGVTTTDPLTYVVVLVGVLLAAITASAIPAWRASRADPLAALRAE